MTANLRFQANTGCVCPERLIQITGPPARQNTNRKEAGVCRSLTSSIVRTRVTKTSHPCCAPNCCFGCSPRQTVMPKITVRRRALPSEAVRLPLDHWAPTTCITENSGLQWTCEQKRPFIASKKCSVCISAPPRNNAASGMTWKVSSKTCLPRSRGH